MGLLPGELGGIAGGICTLTFVAPLQVTPAASPDCNFAGLAAAAAEEQDAEVRAGWTVVPPPRSEGLLTLAEDANRTGAVLEEAFQGGALGSVRGRVQSRGTARLAEGAGLSVTGVG